MRYKINFRGQMLIEIVIAVGILALVLVGVSDLMTRSSKISTFQRKRGEAYEVAKTVINEYKLQRDNDPNVFQSSVAGIDREVCVAGKEFSCLATVTIEGSSVNIVVKVSWIEGLNTFSVSLNQVFGDI
jgi:type II secretory pathway pseudopilin PulG